MIIYHIEVYAWNRIYEFLQTCKGLHTNEASLRKFIEAIWFIARTGCQWRLLPSIYGHWRAIHKRFKSWSNRGIWRELFEYMQIEPDIEIAMLDATIVRAHACAAGYKKDSQEQEALGRSRGGFSTKIHVLVDGLGNPLRFFLTDGQRHEIIKAEALTTDVQDAIVIADKSYDNNALIDILNQKDCIAVIPPKSNRKIQRPYDKHLYRERHLIECFFGKIKHFRRVFSRFDKSAISFLGFLQFVSTLVWLR